jgi:hypothetical protein
MREPIFRPDGRCAYKCPFYLDGPVLATCNKTGKRLLFEGGRGPAMASCPESSDSSRAATPEGGGR